MNSVTPQKRTTPATAEEEIAKKQRTEESDKPSTPLFAEHSVQDEDDIDSISDEELAKLYLSREDWRTLSGEDRMLKSIANLKKAMGEEAFLEPNTGFGYIRGIRYGGDDPLPHGYDWDSYDTDHDYKDYIVGKECVICSIGLDHWTEECPKYDPNNKAANSWPLWLHTADHE